jgi:two-component system, LytTR family, response regulator
MVFGIDGQPANGLIAATVQPISVTTRSCLSRAQRVSFAGFVRLIRQARHRRARNAIHVEPMITPTIRTIIADDECLAGKKLRLLLASEAGVQVVAECQDGQATIAAVQTHKPDLLMINIRMPDLGGFEVLDKIPPEAMPVVVFTTPYDQFAIRAFDARGLDYLLKPFERDRLHHTIERARAELLKSYDHKLAMRILDQLSGRSGQEQSGTQIDDRLVFRAGGKVVFLDLEEVDWIEAAANYVKINAGKESYLLREGIGGISQRLDPQRFVRIHRSIIVNVRKIRELQPCDGGYIAVLKNGKGLSCSRAYRTQLQRLISRAV